MIRLFNFLIIFCIYCNVFMYAEDIVPTLSSTNVFNYIESTKAITPTLSRSPHVPPSFTVSSTRVPLIENHTVFRTSSYTKTLCMTPSISLPHVHVTITQPLLHTQLLNSKRLL